MPCTKSSAVILTYRSEPYSWERRYKTGVWSPDAQGYKSYESRYNINGFCTSGGYIKPYAPTFRSPTPYSGTHTNGYPTVVHSNMLIGKVASWQFRHEGTHEARAPIGFYSTVPDVCAYKEEAEMKAMLKFSDIDFNLPVAFSERKKTLALAEDLLDGVTDLVRSVRRKHPGDFAKSVSNLWLMYRYGLMPTWYDLWGLAETIEKNENGTYDKHRYTSRADVSDVKTEDGTVNLTYSLGRGYTLETQYNRTVRHGCRVRIDAMPNPVTHPLRRLNDLGVLNPALLAWELTPLSFVVDWFIGIGDFLEAYSAPIGLVCLGTSSTCYWKGSVAVTSQTPSSLSAEPILGGDWSPGKAGEHFIFSRFTSSYFPAPSLVIKRHPLNLKRLLDGAALLHQMLR